MTSIVALAPPPSRFILLQLAAVQFFGSAADRTPRNEIKVRSSVFHARAHAKIEIEHNAGRRGVRRARITITLTTKKLRAREAKVT